jgi:uncharacterized RDD family membrane protein YckC
VGPASFCNACGASLDAGSDRSLSGRLPVRIAGKASTSSVSSLLPPASAEKRMVAGLVDLLAAGAVFTLFAAAPLFAYLRLDTSSLALALLVLPLFSLPAYFVGFWAARGATPGQELLGLAIVMKDGSKEFGLRSALVRFAGFCLSLATLGLGFMMILIDGETLHDGLAGTRVVERRV